MDYLCADRKPLLKKTKNKTGARYSADSSTMEGKDTRSASQFSRFFRNIFLLLWKNLLFRKRHYIVTFLEILLPTIFTVLLAYMRTQSERNEALNIDKPTIYPVENENTLIAYFAAHFVGNDCISGRRCMVAWTPKNDFTKKIVSDMRSILPESLPIDWKDFEDEREIEKYSAKIGLNDSSHEELKAAIIFRNGFSSNGQFSKNQNFDYKLRFLHETHVSESLFPTFPIPGPNLENIGHYKSTGFIGLQLLIDKAIIKALSGNIVSPSNISLEAFPYPPYEFGFDFSNFYGILLPQFLVLGFVIIVPTIIRGIVSEKETGIKELMKLLGLPNWLHWFGYLLNSLIILSISITLVVILLFWTFEAKTGAVIINSSPTLWWFVLFLYILSSISFCFFIASFFHRPTIAIVVGIVCWLVSYYGLALIIDEKYQSFTFFDKTLSALFPNTAIFLALKIMCAFEVKGVGATWSNIFEPLSTIDSLNLAFICLMFVIDTVIYFLLALYIECIIPSEYGIRKPWYFIFTKCLRGKKRFNTRSNSIMVQSENDNLGFEKEPIGLEIGIEIQNLKKVYKRKKVAVDGVSLKMYDGQITILLGKNGAGKTSTMSMLCGMFSPTSGTARINGYDIINEMDKVRQNLGLCPQHNMLFDELTVLEHLKFFGQLKGLSSSEALKESKDFMKRLQFDDKSSTLAKNLSGGQKRKLSLGIALIGGTKVVILDEVTSGMDPESRRLIWDLLLEMRGHRTILLTTHFMEEADVLGDRVAIMADGKVKCCGSPMFLKQFYGAGYTLKMSITNQAQPEVILSTIKTHIENAYFKTENISSSELGITLPTDNNPTAKFPNMFSELSTNKKQLGIKNVGLQLTTMDEVFIKIGELGNEERNKEANAKVIDMEEYGSNSNNKRHSSKSSLVEKVVGLRLFAQQFKGVFMKRVMYTFRKRKLVISQMLMPILLLITAILLSNRSFMLAQPPPEIEIKMSSYKFPITYFTSTDKELGDIYAKLALGSEKIEENLTDALLNVGLKDIGQYREQFIVAADIDHSNIKAMYSSIPYHSAPLSVNLVTNLVLKSTSPANSHSISITNHPLQNSLDLVVEGAKDDPIFSITIPILFAVFLPIGLGLMAATYVVAPVEEKLCNVKQLQMMTGLSPFIYWFASFIWDYFITIILIFILVLCFPIFQSYGAFTAYNGLWAMFLILLVYGYASISFSYFVSQFVRTVAGGFSLLTIIHVVTGMFPCLVVFSLELSHLFGVADKIRHFARIFPTFGVGISVMRFTEIATKNSRCNILSQTAKDILCNENVTLRDNHLRSCCDNCATFGPNICFVPKPYITWDYKKENTLNEKLPGIGQELFYLLLLGIGYQILLLVIEYKIFTRIFRLIFKEKLTSFKSPQDEDVLAESARVSNMISNGQMSENAIIVENKCKSYGSFAAVSNLTFGVQHGECFGLLGVNGAGKSTTFRMITGDEIPSNGNAYALMYSLVNNRKKFLSQLGYCPQSDGLIGVLTGREMLHLFARLRGISQNNVNNEAELWLERFGLDESSNVECRKYSGGMKRRLSAAIAMIGDPPILLFDEPTSGVDPVARRQFWQVISSVKESGQAVVLTSHSMEEITNLCSRLAIMVNGNFQCIGDVQHLTKKFAQGFNLTIKLKSLISEDSNELRAIKDEITKRFNPCMLKDHHQNLLNYQIYNTSMPWEIIFTYMEEIKTTWESLIEEYSVNETTLEEVFLQFARKQHPNREANISTFKRLLTCQYF